MCSQTKEQSFSSGSRSHLTKKGFEMGRTKVLIVEDEAIYAMALSMSLRNQGYDIQGPVATGEEAIKIAEQEKPDVIVMDLLLAGNMNGISTAKKIRSINDIPIVFVSGYQDGEILEKARELEFTTCLTKPLKSSEVVFAIDNALHGHKGAFEQA
jgi:CheY-like chemotaxis protein